ncbi:MAG: response regulator transcription factor [Akkermansiaceae bacterium]|nr:response regulator transcription factor [Akkermansiaceae bacterium]
MSAKIRVLIVDDHSMVRMGIAGLLAMECDIEVVAEAEDLKQAVEAFNQHLPDVTLMDIRMQGGSGLEALAAIRKIHPSARILMLSTYDLEEPVFTAHASGAVGYLNKSIKGDKLISAIRDVHAGGFCFSTDLKNHIAARAGNKRLTARELETLDLLRRGCSNKDISRALDISEHTAKFHVKAILVKLDVADRAEAVAAAFERGLLQVE